MYQCRILAFVLEVAGSFKGFGNDRRVDQSHDLKILVHPQSSNPMTLHSSLTPHSTGMKCLPQNKIAQAQGIVLHDWHAEVLALRSFNRFLLEECQALAMSQKTYSEIIRFRASDERNDIHPQPFAIRDDISLHMYCSEAPCGDASMELVQASQADGEPWVVPSPAPSARKLGENERMEILELQGRSYFSELGTIRRKPSRPDAPPTLSKSCSDKLALKQCTSILSSLTSLLISPSNAYIKSFVLPDSQYSETGCERAFSMGGRMKDIAGEKWAGGYSFRPFEITTTKMEFQFSRRSGVEGKKLVPSNIAAGWIPFSSLPSGLETIIAGVKQGRRAGDIRGASRVCKREMWKLARNISELVQDPAIELKLKVLTYGGFKESGPQYRKRVKQVVRESGLRGWIRNIGDESFSLEDLEM